MNQNHTPRRLHYFLMALAVLLFDQASKWIVRKRLSLHDSVRVVPGFFHITHVENQGAAFGLFADSIWQWKVASLILFSVLAMVLVTVLLWRNSLASPATSLALALILGGAMGNLWDRVIQGYVVDFLHFYVGSYTWPDFNIADSAIVIGAFVLGVEILFSKVTAEQPTTAGS